MSRIDRKAKKTRFLISTSILTVVFCLLVTSAWAGTFRDDFEDGNLDGWRQEWQPHWNLWKILDGELECTQRSKISTTLVTGDVTWKDYTIEYDVKLLEKFGPGDVDVAVRVVSLWRFVQFFIGDYFGAPEIGGSRAINGANEAAKRQPFDLLELNKWHHLKLDAQGNHFTFWVNGQKVLDYTDDVIKAGAVGLGLANYRARFDNVEISGPDVPDVTPPTWTSIHPKAKLPTTWAEMKK